MKLSKFDELYKRVIFETTQADVQECGTCGCGCGDKKGQKGQDLREKSRDWPLDFGKTEVTEEPEEDTPAPDTQDDEAIEDSTDTVSITLETMDDAYDADLFARNLARMGFGCEYNNETGGHPSYTISAPAEKEAELKQFVLQRWTVGDPGKFPENMEDCLEGVEASLLSYVKNGNDLDFQEAFADEIAESGYEPFDTYDDNDADVAESANEESEDDLGYFSDEIEDWRMKHPEKSDDMTDREVADYLGIDCSKPTKDWD